MDEDESPFARVPRPGPFEQGDPLTWEGQMNALGKLANGTHESSGAWVWGLVAVVVFVVGLACLGVLTQ